MASGLCCPSWDSWAADAATMCLPQGTMATALWPCGARPLMSSCLPPASQSQCTAWPLIPGMPASWSVWAKVPLVCGSYSGVGPMSASRCQSSEAVPDDGVGLGPRTLLTPAALVSLQGHRVPIPEEVRAGELTSLCYGPVPLLYCGSNAGQVCVWDTSAGRCFLAWEADDGEIGGCPTASPRPLPGRHQLELWAPGAGLMPPPASQECCCVRVHGWSVAATPGGCASGR